MTTIQNQKTISFKEEEKGCIVKYILIVLLFALSICSAQTDKKLRESSNCCGFDSLKFDTLKTDYNDLVKKQNEIIKATEKTLELYDKSFEKMQATYSIFVSKVNCLIAIIGILVTIIVIYVTVVGWRVEKQGKETMKNVEERSDKKIEEVEKQSVKLKEVLLNTDVLTIAEAILPRFKDVAKNVAPNSEIELGELKPGNYVHILRDGKIIGCFGRSKGDFAFQCHNSYKEPKKPIPLSELTDEDIKDIIENTPWKSK
jgi:hypothetical protein